MGESFEIEVDLVANRIKVLQLGPEGFWEEFIDYPIELGWEFEMEMEQEALMDEFPGCSVDVTIIRSYEDTE